MGNMGAKSDEEGGFIWKATGYAMILFYKHTFEM